MTRDDVQPALQLSGAVVEGSGAMTTSLTGSERRNFFSALWHGAFLALGTALTQPTTVVAAFVADLTGSTIWVGGLSTVLTVAAALPQLLVARWIERRPRKMPYLMLAIYLRVVSWGALAGRAASRTPTSSERSSRGSDAAPSSADGRPWPGH